MTRQWAIPQQSYAIRSRVKIYLFSKNMDTHCLPSLRHGAGHKPPSDAKFENVWAIAPLPHTCDNNKDNLTSYKKHFTSPQ